MATTPRLTVYGEQHDQDDQQRQVARDVEALGSQGRLAALVLEMAERGASTAGLARDADEAAVRDALRWHEASWPWARYRPVVMAAHRAGVPVDGGNLPRTAMRAAMADGALEAAVTPEVRARLTEAIDEGHCGLLPAKMLPGMLRVQVARDRTMADAVRDRLQPGRSVVLLTGAQHASRDRGVPWHLVARGDLGAASIRTVVFSPAGADLVADERRDAVVTPQPDRCAALRQRLSTPPAPSAG